MTKHFRETLWFKKGILDGVAADEAAAQPQGFLPGAADLLPIEDRYLDDGTVSGEDSAVFSLRTGDTLPPHDVHRVATVSCALPM